LRDHQTCKICLDEEIAIVFLPCGHMLFGLIFRRIYIYIVYSHVFLFFIVQHIIALTVPFINALHIGHFRNAGATTSTPLYYIHIYISVLFLSMNCVMMENICTPQHYRACCLV
jgi:hypothetical protein